ncbi:mucin-17 isoform X2 [Oncorhynchus tshawytscha]|uniref:mucin-17 isoform X2 n=1 Tax=Oncorhynchus tshawytscha TaxID=74940 RepID=UPI001C3C776E|nr:mucin-17 isoform X2 [Oncorhynchus tshawytscha]
MSLHMETLPDFSVISGETSPLSDSGHSSTPSQHSGISGEPRAKRWSSNPITMLTHILKPIHLGFNGQESCSPILSPIRASKIFRIQDETLPNCTGESLFEDTIDPCFLLMVEPTVGSSTMALSHTPPETCISMKESFTKPEDANKDLQRGSNFSLSLQGSPTALRETMSTSSCSRASLEGTHDISAFEGSKESLHSIEHKVQNLTTDVTVSVVVQKSSVASSCLSNANVTQIICPDSEMSASYTVPLSSSTFGSLCDDKRVNNVTFELMVEPTLEPKTGTNEPNVTTTALEAVEISRPMKDTFEACRPMKFNATTEQETYDGTKQPLNNTFQTNPHVNATTEPVTIVGNARPPFQTDHKPTKSAEVDVREHMVQSQPGPSGRDGDPFTLDDTLEICPNFLLTSTPMVTSTALRKPERPSDVRKKLSSGILPKPAKPPAVSKLATYRKTFLQPQGVTSNPKSLPPPLRSVSQLPSWTRPPKTKTAPVASAPSEPSSAIPSRRCKTRADASEHAVVTVSQQASAGDTSSSRRSTIAESKLMSTGLRKPQSYGTQRSIASLRNPAVRAMATRSTENPSLSSGLNGRSLQAPNQGQKHLPTSSDAFPVAKRKKIGCANYVLLQQELETCRQENERLQTGCANYVLLQQELETCRQENERLQAGCANYVLLQQELETCRQENERLQAGCANCATSARTGDVSSRK